MSFDEEARLSAEALGTHLSREIQERLQEFIGRLVDAAEKDRQAATERVEQALVAAAEEHQAAIDRVQQEHQSTSARHEQALAAAVQERQALADHAQQALAAADQTLQEAVARARDEALHEATSRFEAELADRTSRFESEHAELRARGEAERGDRDAAAEREAIERQTAEREMLLAGIRRLVSGFQQLDEGQSLSQLLDTLATQAAAEAARCALFVVRGRSLQGWSLSGFAGAYPPPPGDPRTLTIGLDALPEVARVVSRGQRAEIQTAVFASEEAEALAFMNSPSVDSGVWVPVTVGGQVAAIVYADDGGREDRPVPASWPEAIELLARHAARCLEAQTAIRAARLSNANATTTAAAAPHQPLRAVSSAQAAPPVAAPVTTMTPTPTLAPTPVPVATVPVPTVSVASSVGMSDAYAEEHARRYARLLIADIRLYNEDAVRVGREQRDLAQRLQPEIARARHAFEERVPASVRQRERFFDEELVRTLADGDEALLGVESQGTQPESLSA